MESLKSVEENSDTSGLMADLGFSTKLNVDLVVKKEQLQEENERLKAENEQFKLVVKELFTDLKTTKTSIMALLKGLGMFDKNGEFKKSINVLSIFSTISTMMGDKSSETFGIEKLIPLLEKYKNL